MDVCFVSVGYILLCFKGQPPGKDLWWLGWWLGVVSRTRGSMPQTNPNHQIGTRKDGGGQVATPTNGFTNPSNVIRGIFAHKASEVSSSATDVMFVVALKRGPPAFWNLLGKES